MKALLFIFNPLAGKGKIRAKLSDALELFKSKGYITTVYPTSAHGDGYSFVKNLKTNYDLIVCSGGDGTLNEIVSGILDSYRKPLLGYIPSGSTNDFARSVGIPIEIKKAIEISCCGKPYALDVGRLNDRYFIYVAGFGAFTKVSYATSQKMKNVLGYLAYLLQGIKELSELRAYSVRISHEEGEIEGRYIVGLIMNSFSIGGFKNPISEVTELNDGVFEVLLIHMPRNIIELQGIVAALLGDPIDSKNVEYFQASHIEIESEEMEWTVDGEYGGKYKKVNIENLNCAINLLVES